MLNAALVGLMAGGHRQENSRASTINKISKELAHRVSGEGSEINTKFQRSRSESFMRKEAGMKRRSVPDHIMPHDVPFNINGMPSVFFTQYRRLG